jgi:hypothetical protein
VDLTIRISEYVSYSLIVATVLVTVLLTRFRKQ